MIKEKIHTSKYTDNKSIIGVGTFKLFNEITSSLITSFGSIFIYINSGKLWHVFFYLALYAFIQISSNLLGTKLFSNRPKLSLILRTIPFLLLYSLFFIKINALMFTIILSIGNGLINSFYFAPMDNIIGSLKTAGKTKTQSIIQFLEYVGIFLSTLIGGFVLDSVDAKLVGVVGVVLYLFATIVFFFMYSTDATKEGETTNDLKVTDKNTNEKTVVRPATESVRKGAKTQINDITKGKFNPFKKYYPWLTEGLVGIFTILEVLWSVYTYIQVGSFAVIGIIKTVIVLGGLLGIAFIGKYSSKRNWKNFVLISVLLVSAIWIVRPFLNIQLMYYLLAIIVGFLQQIIYVPLNSVYYKHYKDSKDKTRKLTQKDAYRKLFAVPLSLMCMIIGSVSISIAILGGILGLAAFQITPAYKDYEKDNDV